MQHSNLIDDGKPIDWGKTSEDYARYRQGPPLSFYEKLKVFGVGLPNQSILDLATGTGVLARQFAKQSATVCGIDISSEQIQMAKVLTAKENLEIDFQVAPSEKIPYADQSFDIITANQSWLYFDKVKTIKEVKRLLKKDGILMVSHFSWTPRLDNIARQTEALILKHNPVWNGNDWHKEVFTCPDWAKEDFYFKALFFYDEKIPYTRESWRGRIRASRGIGASLSLDKIESFDQEHDILLKKIAGDQFDIIHRLDASFFQVLENKP